MEDEHILRDIFLDAAAEEYAAELASTEQVVTSPKFQKQIDKLLGKPKRGKKESKKTIWKQCVQSAAVLLLVCSITLGTVMIVSPTARAAVIEWVIEWYDTHIVYRFFGEPGLTVVPKYDITELPSGYAAPGKEQERVDGWSITYENDIGDVICFQYSRLESGDTFMIVTEDTEPLEVEVGGHIGQIYLSEDVEESNTIVWYDEREKIQFMIDGFVGQEDLLRMANSVSLCKTKK